MSRTFALMAVVVLSVGGAIILLVALTGTPTLPPAVPLSLEPAPVRKFVVVGEFPHDRHALTQGLIYSGGFLYESTGGQGQSSIRKVDLTTGRVIQERAVDDQFLGEGLTEWRGQLIQLTPRHTKTRSVTLADLSTLITSFGRDPGVRYDPTSLAPTSTFTFSGDGWGLTHDDHQFIKSDGTSLLRFLHPDTMTWQAQIAVVDAGEGIRWLNELEFINGDVYANIWQQDRIAIIQLNSGQVKGWIDLSALRSRMAPPPQDVDGLGAYGKAVANGIAYDPDGRRLLVTGKNWPRLFAIRLLN